MNVKKYLPVVPLAVVLIFFGSIAQAQSDAYPNKPIKFVVGFAAGSACGFAAVGADSVSGVAK